MKKLVFSFNMISIILILHMSVLGQTVFWVDSDFDAPRLVKTGADGTELASMTLQVGSQPQSIIINTEGDSLLWTGLGFLNAQINTISTDFNSGSVVVDSQSVLRGIDIDEVNSKIYWVSTNLDSGAKIWRADIDGQSPEVLIDFGTAGKSVPRAIGLDVAGGKMYWTNFSEGKIQRADLAVGAVPEDVVSDLNGPSGIAVDADSGKIFWTEMNGHQIRSAELNGTNVSLLVSDLSYPNYITVKRTINKMAWTELGTGKVKSADLNGTNVYDYGVNANAPTGIAFDSSPVSGINEEGNFQLPIVFALQQNYPNPFNPTTTINYALAENIRIKIEIFNMLGKKVEVLVDEPGLAGYHSYKFQSGNLASGVYLYRIQAGAFVKTKKMLLIR